MPKLLCLFTLAIAAAAVCSTGCNINFSLMDGYNFNYQGVKLEKVETGELDLLTQQIAIANKFGNVTVRAAEPGAAGHWKWTGIVWADSDLDAEMYIEELTLEKIETWKMDLEPGSNLSKDETDHLARLTVLLPESDRTLNGIKSHLEIWVPAIDSVSIANNHGNIDLADAAAMFDVENGHGNCVLKSIVGDVYLENRHGNVSVSQAIGTLEVTNRHGNVSIDDVSLDEGCSIKADVSHGKIKLSNVPESNNETLAAIKLSTTHDDIEVKNVFGDLDLSTTHGKVKIREMVGAVTADGTHTDFSFIGDFSSIDASSTHGDITIETSNSEFEKMKVRSTHGDIELKLPETASIQFKANEDLKSEFASDANGRTANLGTTHGDIRILKAKSMSTSK